jgi:hypothetical protein
VREIRRGMRGSNEASEGREMQRVAVSGTHVELSLENTFFREHIPHRTHSTESTFYREHTLTRVELVRALGFLGSEHAQKQQSQGVSRV